MEEFRARLLLETRALLLREQQSEVSMKSWNGAETKGFELLFEGSKRGVPVSSGVFGQIFVTQDGGFEAIVTSYVFNDGLRSIVGNSFTVTPSSLLSTELASGLSPLALAVTSTLTVNHLLMLGSVRDVIFAKLDTKQVAILGQTCKSAQLMITSSAVDRTFWKEHLKREFGAEKVRETIAKGRQFHGVYCEAKLQKIRDDARVQRGNPIAVDPLADPLRADPFRADPLRVGPARPNPLRYDPDAEFYHPQGGIPFPPGVRDPQHPDFFAGPNHPDLNPLVGGGGLQREIFGPPRGGLGNQGRPFMRGGPGGGFRGDYI